MPTVPVSVPEGPGWRVRATAGGPGAVAVSAVAPAPPPRPLPAAPTQAAGAASTAGTETHQALVVPRRAPLRLLYVPLLAVVILSSVGAVTLLVLHVALHR
jgi:hypothetical protein